jgi:hypothetical protein
MPFLISFEQLYGSNAYEISHEKRSKVSQSNTINEDFDISFNDLNTAANSEITIEDDAHVMHEKVASLLLIEIANKHNLTQEAIEDIMKFTNLVTNRKVFKTKYKTLINQLPNNNFAYNYYLLCKCDKSLGPFSNVKDFEVLNCQSCNSTNDCKELLRDNQYFLHSRLEPQLEVILNNYEN